MNVNFMFVAPTAKGVLLTLQGNFPSVCKPDDTAYLELMETIDDHYGAAFGLLLPVGTWGVHRVVGVGEVYELGLLRSYEPTQNSTKLITALVRGQLTNWRLTGEGNDFSINFLGS